MSDIPEDIYETARDLAINAAARYQYEQGNFVHSGAFPIAQAIHEAVLAERKRCLKIIEKTAIGEGFKEEIIEQIMEPEQ